MSTSAGTGTTISPSSAQVSSGGSTSFTVTLSSGYDTLVVSGCGGSLVGNTYTTGAITANCTVTAGATEIAYTVSTSSGPGVASLSCNDSTVTYGGSTTCTASLATGYENLTLSGCSGTSGGSPYSTGAIYADCTVSASTSVGTGTTLSPSSASVSYGATTSFAAGTTGGYTNLSVSGCFGGSLSGSTFTTGSITADCTVTSTAIVNAPSWTAAVNFTVSSSGGNGKYSVIVSFDGTQECSTPTSGGGHLSAPTGHTCDIGTNESSVTASYSVTAAQHLCSVTETSGSTTLTNSAPTLAVAVVVANNSNKCP